MTKIYVPSKGPESWKKLLVDPERHWQVGKSAYEIANCWEKEPDKFPTSIRNVFKKSKYKIFRNAKLLFAYPEFKVRLDTARAPSQNDVFALAVSENHIISIAVEGKAGEDFNEIIDKWKDTNGKPSGKPDRLEFLRTELGLDKDIPGNIRYQLLHRTASSIIEAKKYNAKHALMIVQNFHSGRPHFDDYSKFADLFGMEEENVENIDSVEYVKTIHNIKIYLAWINS